MTPSPGPRASSPAAAKNFSFTLPGVNRSTDSNVSYPGKTPQVTHPSPNAALPPWTPALMVVLVVLALLLGTLIIIICRMRKRNIKRRPSIRSPSHVMAFSPINFTYDELETATDKFSQQNLLGGGGFGNVFRGRLLNGQWVAIKKLNTGGNQGELEFRTEVEIITRIHHTSIVRLLGHCIIRAERILVYEYMPNGTLEKHLHGNGSQILPWHRRFRAALDIARGLFYMHHLCEPKVVHRDIKSSNVLLDANFRAKVGDFGLAKDFGADATHVTTRPMGTIGYVDPEYAYTGKLTEKSDVYSFGVVVIELVTGRHPTRSQTHDIQPPQEGFVRWVSPLLKEAVEKENYDGLIDSHLGFQYNTDEVRRLLYCAEACTRKFASERPLMKQVVAFLEDCCPNEMRLFGKSRDQHRRWKSR